MAKSPALPVLLVALFLSGTAGIVNQVAWQRGLKVFLGGSEALSSMTVVLVFMLGLGAGSAALSTRAAAVRNPLQALALVELGLFLANVLIGFLLSADLSDSVYTMQRAAIGIGIPLRALYVVAAVLVLGVPCFLMGATIPLASEACQRQLGRDNTSLVGVLLFVNTGGAVIGALASSFYLLPRYGQTAAILTAASLNALAGVAVLAVATRASTNRAALAVPEPDVPKSGLALRKPAKEDVLGFFLGMLSLGYEMYLFRAMALAHEPLPYTFAAVLCGFLLAWAIGVFLSSRLPPQQVSWSILGASLAIALMPYLAELDRWSLEIPLGAATAVACIPVAGFGLAYGGLVARNTRQWGRDVGRFAAWNTAGSCAGILLGTLVGYEMAPGAFAASIAACVAAVFVTEFPRTTTPTRSFAIAAAIAFATYSFYRPPFASGAIVAASYDRDGVVEIDRRGNLVWDGLWHSSFTDGRSHIGSANWLLAVAPVLVHQGPVEDALVVGVGAGITVGTLAKIGAVRRVDAYDINRGLEQILLALPGGTLNIARDPKVRLRWQDGRSGLALNPDRYDLITQQPLYLKQAGSSILLSREYFRLVQSRLKPGGVFTIYSNSQGNQEQAHLVRETAASVFEYAVTFDDGYLIVASDSPIVAKAESFRARKEIGDAVGLEMAAYDEAASKSGRTLFDRLDTSSTWKGGGYVVTDDHPLVEYPTWASALVQLPTP